MARTLIGRLQILVEAMGLEKAKQVEQTINGIETAAKRLSGAPWGVGFQRQLEKLALGHDEMNELRRSWARLQTDISNRGLTKALKSSEIGAWKTATLTHFAQVRAGMRDTEAQARRISKGIQQALKPAYVMLGGYTGVYMAGVLGREAFSAASEGRRVQAEAKFAGLSDDERGAIDVRAAELAERFRLQKSQVFEVLKEASLSMPTTADALAVSEEMSRAFLVLSNMIGPQGAIGGLRAFNKAMDNIEKVTPEEYRYAIENYMKAQQVVGRDMDPEAFAQAIKYARTGGKVFGEEFLFQWLPMIIAESGGSDAGTQLRAGFDQFIVGRASKQALKNQRAMGIRDDNGLIAQDEFTKNPITWVYDHLLPALKAKGVDTQNETELARVVGELTNNRLSSDLIMRALLSFEQYRRLVEQRLPNAQGLSAADQVQDLNPFAAFQGFKDSLKNLSDAVLPMESISAGLNSFADAINGFARRIRDADPTTLGIMGAAGVGVAGFGAWKFIGGIWALLAAGPQLQTAAAMLQAAAVAQGGGGVVPDAIGGPKGGLRRILTNAAKYIPFALALADGTAEFISQTSSDVQTENLKPKARRYDEQRTVAEIRDEQYRNFHGVEFEGGRHRAAAGYGPGPGEVTSAGIDSAVMQAARAGAEIQKALSVTGTPVVDASSIGSALSLAQQLEATLGRVMNKAAAARSAVDAQVRRGMADYGVTP